MYRDAGRRGYRHDGQPRPGHLLPEPLGSAVDATRIDGSRRPAARQNPSRGHRLCRTSLGLVATIWRQPGKAHQQAYHLVESLPGGRTPRRGPCSTRHRTRHCPTRKGTLLRNRHHHAPRPICPRPWRRHGFGATLPPSLGHRERKPVQPVLPGVHARGISRHKGLAPGTRHRLS